MRPPPPPVAGAFAEVASNASRDASAFADDAVLARDVASAAASSATTDAADATDAAVDAAASKDIAAAEAMVASNASRDAAEAAADAALATGDPYENRSAFLAATVPAPVMAVSWRDGGQKFAVYRDVSGSIAQTNGTRWAPLGDVWVDHFGDNTTPGTTLTATFIQAAVDYKKSIGGGEVHCRAVTYLTNQTIVLDKNVRLVGRDWYFLNDYTNADLEVAGSIIKLAPGSNVDVIRCETDITDLSGGSFPRAHVGLKNIMIHGNKSLDDAPGANDLNSAGHCVRARGVSYVKMENVLLFRAAEKGHTNGSYDYGDGNGLRSCNNFHFDRIFAINCGDVGFENYAGDSEFSSIIVGYNGTVGLRAGAGVFTNVLAWNNQEDNIRLSGEVGLHSFESYDAGHAGVNAVSGEHHSITGGHIYTNGKKQTAVPAETCGINIDPSVVSILIDGNQIFEDNLDNQKRGIYCSGAGPRIALGTNQVSGHPTSDISLADYSTVSLHGDTGSVAARHPGFTADGTVDMDGQDVRNIGVFTFNGWATRTSIASGVLDLGSNALVSANVSGGGTVTDLTGTSDGIQRTVIRNINSTSLTFEHSTSKLRMNGGADVTLAQNEAIEFAFVSGDVWQHIGGKV